MLTRSIDLDPFDLSFEEKVFRGAKRICVIFALAALTLSTLDLMNVRVVENTAEFIHDHHTRLADLPQVIRAGISQIAIAAPPPASATVLVPRDELAMAPLPVSFTPAAAPNRREASPVAGLSAVRHQDAIEVAMAQPAVMASSAKTDTAQGVMAYAALEPAVEPMKLASIAPDTLATPAPTPVSLPMSAVIPLDTVPMPRAAPPQSPAQLLHRDVAAYAKAERCLANAVYFEARSEPVRGQMAVAQVVMNRVFSGFYPHDV